MTILRVGLPTSINIIQEIPTHRNAQILVAMVVLNPVKLTFNEPPQNLGLKHNAQVLVQEWGLSRCCVHLMSSDSKQVRVSQQVSVLGAFMDIQPGATCPVVTSVGSGTGGVELEPFGTCP